MKRTIITCSYNRPIQDDTMRAISQLLQRGAAYVPQKGVADVTLARNMALTGACAGLRKLNTELRKQLTDHIANPGFEFHPSREFDARRRDMILMVDDDMQFQPDQAQELVNHARCTGVAASAMYATLASSLAASAMDVQRAGEPRRWLTGLGLIAIPAVLLLELERDSERFEMLNGTNVAFTSSGAKNGRWMSEDFTLTERLGGVHLLPIAVGHLKTIPIYPDAATVELIRAGKPLPLKAPTDTELPPIALNTESHQ